MSFRTPYLMFLADAPDQLAAKTAAGVAHWRPDWCIGQLRLDGCKADLKLPDMSVEEAAAAGIGTVIVGVANRGGVIGPAWIEQLVRACELGFDIASGLHAKLTDVPAIVTIGAIKGGIRHNIIPDEVEMLGTFRTFRPDIRDDVIARIRVTAENIARASGASAEVFLGDDPNPAIINSETLTRRMIPALERVAPGKVRAIGLQTVAEDFAYYARRVPSLFFWVGVTPPGTSVVTAPSNHSPLFYVDEDSLLVGLRAMLGVAVDYLERGPVPAEAQLAQ